MLPHNDVHFPVRWRSRGRAAVNDGWRFPERQQPAVELRHRRHMSNLSKELEEGVEKDAAERKRRDLLARLAPCGASTLEDLFNVCENSKIGALMKTITLDELRATGQDVDVEVEPPTPGKKKATKKKAAKKKAAKAKAPKAKKAPKKKAKAKAKGKNGVSKKKAAANDGRKARQDYDALAKEVMAYMGKAGGPISTGALCTQFDLSGSQARKVMEQLMAEKKVKKIGTGGRSTKYDLK